MDRQFNNSLMSETDIGPEDTETAPVQEEVVEATPQRVRVRIGDAYHEVDQSLAETLEAERKKRDDDYFRKISEQGNEIAKLRQDMKQYQPVVQAEEDTTAADTEYYQSPTKTIEARLERERKALKKEVTEELTAAYAAEQAAKKNQDQYAAQFYGKHEHLVGKEDLVYNIYGQNAAKMEGLSWDQQHQLLAQLVDEQFKKWTGEVVPRKSSTVKEEPVKGKVVSTKPVVSERGATKGPAVEPQVQQDDDDSDDLTEFLKKERIRTRRYRLAN